MLHIQSDLQAKAYDWKKMLIQKAEIRIQQQNGILHSPVCSAHFKVAQNL